MVLYSRSNKISIGVFIRFKSSSIKGKFSTLINTTLNQSLYPLFRLRRNQRSQICTLFEPPINFQSLCPFNQIIQPTSRFPYEDNSRKCHTTLSSSSKSSSRQRIQRVIFVCIWHYNSMIFSAQVRLNTFPVRSSSII